MRFRVIGGGLLCVALIAGQHAEWAAEEPGGLLEQVQDRMRENLERLPDYTCRQTVDRWMRATQKRDFEKMDTLRLEVGVVGDREIFAWQGSERFEDRQLAEMVNRGTIGNGEFALHARNVFLSGTAVYTYKGEEVFRGRRVHRYEYGVPIERSRYRLRVPPVEAVVGYSGTFLVDAENLDLVRLEVSADEIPEKLAVAAADLVLEYARIPIGDRDFLLPKASRLRLLGIHGEESRNATEFSECRQFISESKLRFAGVESVSEAPESGLRLAPRAVLEIQLANEVDLTACAVGDPVEATLLRPVQSLDGRTIAAGATVEGRVVRLERKSLPFDHFEIGLEFHQLRSPEGVAQFTATMIDAGGSGGIVKQSKRMDPVFTKKREARFDILVRETPKGQGVLHYEARRGVLKRGTRMKWVVD
jgi:hypothetical protein